MQSPSHVAWPKNQAAHNRIRDPSHKNLAENFFSLCASALLRGWTVIHDETYRLSDTAPPCRSTRDHAGDRHRLHPPESTQKNLRELPGRHGTLLGFNRGESSNLPEWWVGELEGRPVGITAVTALVSGFGHRASRGISNPQRDPPRRFQDVLAHDTLSTDLSIEELKTRIQALAKLGRVIESAEGPGN